MGSEETKFYLSLIAIISLLGVMIGSLSGGPIIKGGRRRSALIVAPLIYIGASITMYRSVWTILTGRFLQGFAAGIFNICTMKSIVESVPVKYAGMFGAATNIGLACGGLTCVMVGLAVPTDPEEYKDDEWWRLTYAFPMVIITIQLIIILTIFRWEPIDFSIKAGKDQDAV